MSWQITNILFFTFVLLFFADKSGKKTGRFSMKTGQTFKMLIIC